MTLPSTLPRRVWVPLVILLLVSGTLAQLLGQGPELSRTPTSYGAVPEGWGAAYDLLHELGLSVSRTRQRLSARDLARAQWLIAPSFDEAEAALQAAEVTAFAERGGTVVVIGAHESLWRALALTTVQGRNAKPDQAAPANDDASSPPGAMASGVAAVTLHGAPLARARRAEVVREGLFVPDASEATARVLAPHGAFVVERAIGRGRLVAVADAGFLRNGELDAHEHARLLVDLARAYGPLAFDERCHGLTTQPSIVAALGPMFIATSTLALALLALALLSFARRWPPATHRDEALEPPTLAVFVGALAALYEQSGRREADAVFRAYHAGFMRRLARTWYGLGEVSGARFEARLAAEAARRGADGAILRGDARIHTRTELTRAVAVLERVLEAAHGSKQ